LDKPSHDDLTTGEAKSLIDELFSMGRPVLIFSGGEPLYRGDLLELAGYAKTKGLPIALSTNGTLVDADIAKRLKAAGIYYASISLDGGCAETHDGFRGEGNFAKALEGFEHLCDAGIKVQVNFTVTRVNVQELPAVYDLAMAHGAIALYLFLLVPVGCGVQIAKDQMLSPREVEDWLRWVCEWDRKGQLPLKAICAPHIFRMEEQYFEPPSHGQPEVVRKGCLAGIHMCFISHKGEVFPCGYLPLAAGNIRERGLRQVWDGSPLFGVLRDPDLLTGRCGACEFSKVCGGCRARAFFAYGDVLAEEPYCAYTPPRLDPAVAAG
jgi:radical SAM protein with 4Fe4S-binding SPASM domain